jgi:Flp pilus assembly protein TadG
MITWILRKRFVRDTRGVAMLEFALILIVLLMILLGVIQFGLIWYTKYGVACASRQGARWGVIAHYDTVSGHRLMPSAVTPSIEEVARQALNHFCPTLSEDMVDIPTPTGAGYTTGAAGQDLTVTVRCQNPWNLLGWLMPSLNSLTFQAATTMRIE